MSDQIRKEVWMDSVCFEDELGMMSSGNRVFPSEANLRKHYPCIDANGFCVAKRVYVVDADATDAHDRTEREKWLEEACNLFPCLRSRGSLCATTCAVASRHCENCKTVSALRRHFAEGGTVENAEPLVIR